MQNDDQLRALLASVRRIAVLGAHPDQARPAYYVPDYLHRHGYRILPVNPVHAGEMLWGETVRARLRDLEERADVIDVFRRADQLAAHIDDILAARPSLVWLQSGIRNEAVARVLENGGLSVIQDRCLMVEHRRLFG
jgi:predicted CoA-binding protein